MFLYGFAGIGYFYLGQLLGGVIYHLAICFFLEFGAELLIPLHVDGAEALVARHDIVVSDGLVDFFKDVLVVGWMTSQTKSQYAYLWHIAHLEYAWWGVDDVGRHLDKQSESFGGNLIYAVDDGDMVGQGALQEVGTCIADIHEQCSGLAIHESADARVDIVKPHHIPVELLVQRVECPQTGIVALCSDHFVRTKMGGNVACQVVGATDMAGENGDDVEPETVDADHGRVGMLVFDVRGDGAHADAHGTDENEGIIGCPLVTNIGSLDEFGTEFALQLTGDFAASIANLNDGYFLHDNISMGL